MSIGGCWAVDSDGTRSYRTTVAFDIHTRLDETPAGDSRREERYQMNKRQNCWEFKECGREVGGSRARELGICAAALEIRLDDVHGGLNGGRACWVVAGTYCGGKAQGEFVQKYHDCKDCDFYRRVMEEDGHRFELALSLLKRLR